MGVVDGLVPKVRKRGCSSSSSASSRIHNCRFKRAIVVGKVRHVGLGGSRSSTPAPSWKATPLPKTALEPPVVSQARTSRPVSARKLAATLWEMKEVPSPQIDENLDQRKKEKMGRGHTRSGSVSSPLPPHLCDPSHSPVSERFDRSGNRSYRKRMPTTTSHRLRPINHNTVGIFDSLSSTSLMEMETRSRTSVSVVGIKTHLKDISNALTTSKELLKIIIRIWANADPPSSTTSLVSALHAELERARLQVNKLITQEPHSDRSEINHLIKCYAEDKAAWKNREQTAIESIATELEAERKLRRRCENLNSKLGKELSETKASLVKAVKELEDEKKAREMIEQMCNDLARDIDDDRAEVEDMKMDSAKVHQEIEKERVHTKFSEPNKHQVTEKNSAVDKLRKQLEAFLGRKKSRRKGITSKKVGSHEKMAACLNKTLITSHHQNMEKEDDGEESAESDLHSIELSMENNNKSSKGTYFSPISRGSKRISVDEMKARSSLSGQAPRTNTTLPRRISDAVDWGGTEAGNPQNPGHGLDLERLQELEKLGKAYAHAEELQRIKAMAGMKNHTLAVSSPSRQWDQPRGSRDTCITHEGALKLRLGVGRSKW